MDVCQNMTLTCLLSSNEPSPQFILSRDNLIVPDEFIILMNMAFNLSG